MVLKIALKKYFDHFNETYVFLLFFFVLNILIIFTKPIKVEYHILSIF